MKRAVFSLALICLAVVVMASGQSVDKRDCPFDITGMWRSDRASETSNILFSYSPDGSVTLFDYSSKTLPQDFEVITSVSYSIDNPAAPKRIEFTAWRGNDLFQQGVTWWKVIGYSDNSFTTSDPVSGQQTRWVREQTHRYFLTLAARSGRSKQNGPAFAMWTVLDGRKTEIDALGVHTAGDETGRSAPVFGAIPAELYNQIIEENEKEKKSNKDEIVVMRFELTGAEFKATHDVYQTWDKRVNAQKLPNADPYRNAVEFLSEAVEGLNECGEKAKLKKLSGRERDEILSKHKPPQQPLEYIKMTRKRNDEIHVTDAMFPWVWRPMIQLPGQ